MTRACKNHFYSQNCEPRSEDVATGTLKKNRYSFNASVNWVTSTTEKRIQGVFWESWLPLPSWYVSLSVYTDADLASQMFSKNSKHSWPRHLLSEGLSRLQSGSRGDGAEEMHSARMCGLLCTLFGKTQPVKHLSKLKHRCAISGNNKWLECSCSIFTASWDLDPPCAWSYCTRFSVLPRPSSPISLLRTHTHKITVHPSHGVTVIHLPNENTRQTVH